MQLSEDRRARYLEKLEFLESNFLLAKKGLSRLSPDDPARSDILDIYGVLHAIQVTIQSISDIAAMFVKDHGKIMKNNYENLRLLESQGLFQAASTESLFNLIGLRNRITHVYNELDKDVAFQSFKENAITIQEFIKGIKEWIGINKKQ